MSLVRVDMTRCTQRSSAHASACKKTMFFEGFVKIGNWHPYSRSVTCGPERFHTKIKVTGPNAHNGDIVGLQSTAHSHGCHRRAM